MWVRGRRPPPREGAHAQCGPSLNLGSYDSVKAHASIIYRRLSLSEMPPGRPWPKEQVDKFKQWMDEQYPP
jgi:hypothetical protein